MGDAALREQRLERGADTHGVRRAWRYGVEALELTLDEGTQRTHVGVDGCGDRRGRGVGRDHRRLGCCGDPDEHEEHAEHDKQDDGPAHPRFRTEQTPPHGWVVHGA